MEARPVKASFLDAGQTGGSQSGAKKDMDTQVGASEAESKKLLQLQSGRQLSVREENPEKKLSLSKSSQSILPLQRANVSNGS